MSASTTTSTTAPAQKVRKKARASSDLQVGRGIRRIVPSAAWEAACASAVVHGRVKPRPEEEGGIAAALAERGVFPPGPATQRRDDRLADPSPVRDPMCRCGSRTCTTYHRTTSTGRPRASRRYYPANYRQGQLLPSRLWRVRGTLDGGKVREDVRVATAREAVAQLRRQGVAVSDVELVAGQDARPVPICEDCRLAIDHDRRREEQRREREAERDAEADGAAQTDPPEVDFRGVPVEPEEPRPAVEVARDHMIFYGERPQEAKLASEDEGVLRRQIDRYMAGRKTSLITV